MLEFRRKNLLVGEDHHQSALKQAARSSTEETALKQPTPSGTSPPTDSQERQASTHRAPPQSHTYSYYATLLSFCDIAVLCLSISNRYALH